jgi:hypothetical protein
MVCLGLKALWSESGFLVRGKNDYCRRQAVLGFPLKVLSIIAETLHLYRLFLSFSFALDRPLTGCCLNFGLGAGQKSFEGIY